jgi:hypothetical protein
MMRCESALEAWSEARDAFTQDRLDQLNAQMRCGGTCLAIVQGDGRLREDYLQQLLKATQTWSNQEAFAQKCASWPDRLRRAIREAEASNAYHLQAWSSSLAGIFTHFSIEWAPGSQRNRLLSTQTLPLLGRSHSPKRMLLTGPPGSLQRMAGESQARDSRVKQERLAKRRTSQ